MSCHTRRDFLIASSALLIGRPALAAASLFSSPGERLAIIGDIIDPGSNNLRKNHGIIIADDRIQDIIPAQRIPDTIPVLSSGGWILPGIINSHVHRVYTPHDRAERFLQHGVTSIGDVGSPLRALPLLADTSTTTSTAAATGPMLCAPGGYPLPVHSQEYSLEIQSISHGRDTVRALADHGATMVKLSFEPGPNNDWPLLDVTTAAAICDQARALSMVVRCHVEQFSGLRPALEAGAHTIEHVPIHPDGLPHEYRSLLRQMARNNVILTPTLDVASRTPSNGPKLLEPVRFFHQIGGKIALGNDYPFRRTDAGMPLREMNLMQKVGMNAEAILESATTHSATACNFNNRGRLTPGAKADIVVTQTNPLKDLQGLQALKLIIKDGKPVKI